MKKLFSFLAALLFVGTGYAQTFPVQNLQVNGTATFASTVAVAGPATFASSVAVTGNLTAPTPTIPDSSSKVATTDFVSKTAPCPSVLAYGGDNTFTNDNAAAFAAAAAANPTGNVCVYFPPGKYKFATNVAYTLPTTSASITVQGAGSDVSILAWTNGGGLTITSQSQNNSQHIRNLTFTTQGTGVGNGLTLQSSAASNPQPDNSAFSDISGVTFRGDDGYDLINYWNVALSINGTSNINLINDRIQGPTNASGYTSVGTGVVISGTSAQLPVVFNFSSCTMNDIGTAILVAAPMQGMSVTQSNFVGGTYGILVNAGLSNFAEMTVMASQFNVANTAILTNTAVPNLQIVGNVIYVPNNANGINLAQAGLFSIIGNSFNESGSTGMNGVVVGVTENNWPGIITGNNFNGMSAAAIVLGLSSNHVSVQSNVYIGSGTNIANSGTSNTIGGGSI